MKEWEMKQLESFFERHGLMINDYDDANNFRALWIALFAIVIIEMFAIIVLLIHAGTL